MSQAFQRRQLTCYMISCLIMNSTNKLMRNTRHVGHSHHVCVSRRLRKVREVREMIKVGESDRLDDNSCLEGRHFCSSASSVRFSGWTFGQVLKLFQY